MYNLNSHYENIFNYLKTIVAHSRLLYLHPYGSTQPENIESISENLEKLNQILLEEQRPALASDGPMFIFYDQEPIHGGNFNYTLLDHIKNNLVGPFVLVTTEKNSKPLNQIQERYGWPVVYYFHHVFAAHDWFRGVKYNINLIPPAKRQLTKKYISFNRLTSAGRVYRTLLISELYQRGLLDQGYVSYNDCCPDGGTYQENLNQAVSNQLITQDLANLAIDNISKINLPLRIDYKQETFIPNHSFVLSAVEETQESFCYLVTETCYWETKCHLTEKIFKPIVSRMPFVLVGPAHNLEYLRSYGFKTFSPWIDETYDNIEDPIERMTAIGNTMSAICDRSIEELETMLKEMQEVLDYNYNLFNSPDFLDSCWQELTTNIKESIDLDKFGQTFYKNNAGRYLQ